jgi:hypothetical protein
MKNEVSIKLQGGLGNNLFQIACAYAYSLRHNKELILTNEKFGITHNGLDTYKDNILVEVDFTEKCNLSKFKGYNEPFFHYQEIPKIEDSIYLNGYYQSEKYFLDFEKEIRELFYFPAEIRNVIKEKYKEILNKNTCSIHVRRGDYLKFPDHHPVQSVNYYMKAIRTMPEDSLFLIFSDDINWCKQNFPNIENKFMFIEGNKDYEDLLLMSLCKNNTICNSSFSWWGAWLNENENKIVVAPSKWFGAANSSVNNTVDLYCKNWKVI